MVEKDNFAIISFNNDKQAMVDHIWEGSLLQFCAMQGISVPVWIAFEKQLHT